MTSTGDSAYSTNRKLACPGHTQSQGTSILDVENSQVAALRVGNRDDVKGEQPRETIGWADDPENAQNWPCAVKVFHTVIPAGIALVCALASSIYIPGVEDVMNTFNVSTTVALLPYSFYILGLAFGPVIASPCSESFGRKAVYLFCVPIFAFFILGSGFSHNIESLTICRFLAGVFGSPGLSIGSGTIADVWSPAERAIPMSAYVTTPFLGPALGPLIGGYVVPAEGWRWTQWVILFFTVTFLSPAFFIRETYKKRILQNRAAHLGSQTPVEPHPPIFEVMQTFLRFTLTRPIRMLLTEPIVSLCSLYIAFNFALLYAFYAAFPYVWEAKYGFDTSTIFLTFLGIGVGCLIGFSLLVLDNKYIYKPRVARWRAAQASAPDNHPEAGNKATNKAAALLHPLPELRLPVAIPASIILPASLFIFAWTTENSVHWIVPVTTEALFGAGNLIIFMACTLYLMDTYGPLHGASAMAANTLLRYVLGAVFPLFAVQMFEGLGVGWATSLLAFVSVVLAAIPWVLLRWGERLRAKCKYRYGV